MDKMCGFCLKSGCPFEQTFYAQGDCVFNLIIYENDEKVLFYNNLGKRIFEIERGKGLREICFQEAVREIDTIPTAAPEWKRLQILKLAKELGFFGIN